MTFKIRNPIPWSTLHTSEVDSHKLDLCVFYGLCLSDAAEQNWRGFSCTRCQVFKEEYGKEPKLKTEGEARDFLETLNRLGVKP